MADPNRRAAPGIHVLDRIDAVAVEIGERHPVLVDLDLLHQRRGRLVGVHRPRPVVHILQVEEVALAELRIEIEVGDVALAGEGRRILELDRPDRVVGSGEGGGVRRVGLRRMADSAAPWLSLNPAAS